MPTTNRHQAEEPEHAEDEVREDKSEVATREDKTPAEDEVRAAAGPHTGGPITGPNEWKGQPLDHEKARPSDLSEVIDGDRPGGERDEDGFRTHRTPAGYYPDAPENASTEED